MSNYIIIIIIIIISYAELARSYAVHQYSKVKETLLSQPFADLAGPYRPVERDENLAGCSPASVFTRSLRY